MATTEMRAGSLAVALVLTLVLASTLGARPAHACSCAGSGSTEEMFRAADAVFAGEAVEIGELPTGREGPMEPTMPNLAPVTFDVGAAWKGVEGDSVVVHGQGPGASCGLNFERGETYLVFAGSVGEGENGPLQTDLCSSTRQASEETARNMFGPPTGTLPETGGVPIEGTELGVGPTLAAAAVLASLAAGVVFAGRVARRPER